MNEVKDVMQAANIALDYLAKKGIAVFTMDVRSAFRGTMI